MPYPSSDEDDVIVDGPAPQLVPPPQRVVTWRCDVPGGVFARTGSRQEVANARYKHNLSAHNGAGQVGRAPPRLLTFTTAAEDDPLGWQCPFGPFVGTVGEPSTSTPRCPRWRLRALRPFCGPRCTGVASKSCMPGAASAPKGRLIVLLFSWPTVTRNACSASAPMGPSRSTSRRHSQEATPSASGAETEAQEEVASHHRTSIPPAWTGLSSCFPVCFGLRSLPCSKVSGGLTWFRRYGSGQE